MRATAAWQAAWGGTDFTLYYAVGDRPAEQHRAYCDYVGRLNAVLKRARPVRSTLLYYPIHDLQAEYLPVAGPVKLSSQSPRAQRIVGSFMRLGQMLQRAQIPAMLIDHEHLGNAKVTAEGRLAIGGRPFESIVLPEAVELPAAVAQAVRQFAARGGRILRGAGEISPKTLVETLKPRCRLSPASGKIALGEFTRDGRRILLLVNVAPTAYHGHLTTGTAGEWASMDPATGGAEAAGNDQDGRVSLSLAPRRAVFLISP